MGTEKRERQKANKALKQNEVVRAEQRRRGTRIAVIVIGAVVAVIGLVWVASVLSTNGDDDTPAVDDFSFGADDGVTDTGPEVADAPPDTTAAAAAPADVGCPPIDGTAEQFRSFSGPPPDCLDPDTTYQAVVTTNKGEFTIDLDQEQAPSTVNNFVFLARYKYFDDTACHRIIPGFVVQCGDPTGSGTGSPGYRFSDELPDAGEYEIGSVAMANSGPDTNGSQFFVITGQQGVELPPQYSLFGDVAAGFDDTVTVLEASGTASGDPSEPVEILTVEIIES